MSAGYIVMAINATCGYFVSSLKEFNKPYKRLNLLFRRRSSGKISDKTNSDTLFIGPVADGSAGMSAGLLLPPSKSHLNLTIAAIGAVSDDKVVTHAAPAVAFFVPFIKNRHITVRGGRVVNNYCRPAPL